MDSGTLSIDPSPDFRRLEQVLRREGEPDRVPFYELFSNLTDPVLQRLGQWEDSVDAMLTDEERENRQIRNAATYALLLGYDHVTVVAKGFVFPQKERVVEEGTRGMPGNAQTIASRQEFEAYPWPNIKTVDYSLAE